MQLALCGLAVVVISFLAWRLGRFMAGNEQPPITEEREDPCTKNC